MISLRGRDPVSLVRILPGVQQGVDTDQFGGAYSVPVPEFQGRGGNTLYVDGVNGGDGGGGGNFSGATNIDAIAEVNVQMGAYTAEYGLKGGTQVNFITKRGGEQYHGTAYWYVRNEWFNANTWLGNHTRLPTASQTGNVLLDAGRQHRRAGTVQDPNPQPQGQPDVLLLLAGRHSVEGARVDPAVDAAQHAGTAG
jgi:hypothetical protein